MRHHRLAFIVLVPLALAANTVLAQSPTSFEPNRKWVSRITVGLSQTHPWERGAEWVEFRVGRKIGEGMTTVAVGLACVVGDGMATSVLVGTVIVFVGIDVCSG